MSEEVEEEETAPGPLELSADEVEDEETALERALTVALASSAEEVEEEEASPVALDSSAEEVDEEETAHVALDSSAEEVEEEEESARVALDSSGEEVEEEKTAPVALDSSAEEVEEEETAPVALDSSAEEVEEEEKAPVALDSSGEEVEEEEETAPVALDSSAGNSKSFTDLLPDLPSVVIDALAARGIHKPTPIQLAAIERIYRGESLLLNAETGSGKSLAFLLPILQRLGLAGLEELPESMRKRKVLIGVPTRELAVQLANEAAMLLPAPGAVQICAMGARPSDNALSEAAVITFTADSLFTAVNEGKGFTDSKSPLSRLMDQASVLVLDELDVQMPVEHLRTYTNARDKKKATKKNAPVTQEEEICRQVLEANLERNLQVIAASATISKQSQMKLARVLRKDPSGRFFKKPPPIVRPENLFNTDLTLLPRAVIIPSAISHYYVRLPKSIKLQRLTPQAQASPKMKKLGKLTLKQKRAEKIRARDIVQEAERLKQGQESEIHPLLTTLKTAIEEVKPASAIVFLCRSTGMTVRKTVRELQTLGMNVKALHEIIGLEHDLQEGEEEEKLENPTQALLRRHSAISDAFTSQIENESHDSVDIPLIVTFEDMARGLHFDAVEAVFVLGIPDSPQTYLHLAGRTGRQPVLEGKVITICPGKSNEKLKAWSNRLGDVHFEELVLPEVKLERKAAPIVKVKVQKADEEIKKIDKISTADKDRIKLMMALR